MREVLYKSMHVFIARAFMAGYSRASEIWVRLNADRYHEVEARYRDPIHGMALSLSREAAAHYALGAQDLMHSLDKLTTIDRATLELALANAYAARRERLAGDRAKNFIPEGAP